MDIVTLLVQSFLLAVGLSMDAFAVSISNGLSMKQVLIRRVLAIAVTFGIFQALMPLLGYLLGNSFAEFVRTWDHYIALIFLGVIGIKMIIDGINEIKAKSKGEDEICEYKFTLGALIFQGIATSIDALVIGVSFVAMRMTFTDMLIAIGIIGVTTFVLSFIGVFAGKKFGDLLGSKAEIVGGIILVGIGLKVFIEHAFFGG